ncbi:Trigger factor [Metamycoplasma arthritidis]|uniref:Trigger factor n=1 Tax=Metamycoplasma arthritidis (strain 158L3-1) TaxID=243272 RepID=B3PNH4_META1|nr:trigger factor [Metamycoplasma arthritidis]ACF07576.1 trigger factor (prolyl isomerase) [Metamycoplasma arthritidis 158L3-1]VEU79084.1 Trigger factor [Metamycoplasma arthritidis]
MSRTIDNKKSELKISYTLEGDEWENAKEKARVELRKNVQIKGFRKGKVPAREADKHIPVFEVWEKAIKAVAQQVFRGKLATQVEATDEIIGRASLDIEELKEEKATLVAIYPIFPEIKLGDYKKLGIKVPSLKATKDEINHVKNDLLSKFAVMVEAEDGIKNGDEVNFDFTGYIEGELFDGGEAEGYTLNVGSGTFIPGFEEQMLGLKKDEEKDLHLKFPENYHAKNLAGKEVTFHVKINYTKRADYPALDDDFVKTANIHPSLKTVADFEKFVEAHALINRVNTVENEIKNLAQEKLVATSKFEVPTSVIEDQVHDYYQNFVNNLMQQQISEREYLDFTKTSKETLLKNFEDQAIPNLKKVFVVSATAKEEKFAVTEDDYKKEVQKLADSYGLPVENVQQFIKFETIQIRLTDEWFVKTIIKYNDPEGFKKYEEVKKSIEKHNEEEAKALAKVKEAKANAKEEKESSKKETK